MNNSYKIYVSVLFCPIVWLNIFAQPNGKIVLDKTTPATSVVVTATEQVVLKPGFHATADVSSSFNARIGTSNSLSPMIPVAEGSTITVPSSPSNNQNYILTKTFLTATTDVNTTSTLNTIQYFDGLGRLTQTVAAGFTPLGADLVSCVGYDGAGRENIKYLPVAVGGNFGLYVDDSSINSATGTLYGQNNRPYVETLLEASPLNRVAGQKRPGAAWAGHPYTISYGANSGNILCFSVVGNVLVKGANYSANTLYKTTTTDEDGKPAVEYKDKLGRVIVKQLSTDVYTYYVYNDLNQLAYVLPPAFIDGAGVATSFDDSHILLNQYAYVYRYDRRGNCIYKKLPGSEPIYMVYDKADRLVLSQDGNQRPANKWTVTKYDIFGRMIYSGITTETTSHTDLIADLSDEVITESFVSSPDSNTPDYSGGRFTPEKLLIVNYYDSYDFLLKLTEAARNTLAYTVNPPYGEQHPSAKGLLTGTRTYLLDDSGQYTTKAMYYDDRGRVVQIRSTNHLGGYDLTFNLFKFTGEVLSTFIKHKIASGDEITELYRYNYDNGLRLLTTSYCLNGGASIILMTNTYDELGRLTSKNRHNNLEKGLFEYNIQNWPTKVKHGEFEETLKYNENPGTLAFFSPCYNGNIAYNTWNYKNEVKGYCYEYDQLNRLTTGYSATNGTIDWLNNEYYEFDKMGNISSLDRFSDGNAIDYLQYEYNGNQVQNITDNASPLYNLYNIKQYNGNTNTSQKFLYDNNGNLIVDRDRNICAIKYNILNLPQIVQFRNGNVIINLYDGSGRKLQSEYYTCLTANIPLADGQIMLPAYTQSTHIYTGKVYIDNLEYDISKTSNVLTNTYYNEYYFSRLYNDEGYVENISSPQYYYYRRDHLGTNREVWLANTNTVVQRTQYYPSGLPWVYQPDDNAYLQHRKYNGKEFIEMHGYDTYDYGARGYYAAIGRWTSVDPLAEKYYGVSPYAYCMNNPVNRVDPDGKDGMVTGTGSKDNPYIITATYYYQNGSLNKEQIEGLNSAVDAYNKSGGKNGVEIKNADGKTSYVKYNLSAQEVDDVDAARKTTAFETSSGETRYYGNTVGTQPNEDGVGGEFGSANNVRVDFNLSNINAATKNGMKSISLNKGVAIHEIGHNLGGEHSDGTTVMDIIQVTNNTSQIGGLTTTSYSFPSMSTKFTKIIFMKRDTPKTNWSSGRLWTLKP